MRKSRGEERIIRVLKAVESGRKVAGVGAAAALRAGDLRSESGKALSEDLAYWAPFVLVGEVP